MAYKNVEDQRAASKRHYLANKKRYLERNKRYRLQIRDMIRELKDGKPCTDCRAVYPYYVMDFDHLKAEAKIKDINFLSSTGRIGALKIELEKCELVCANCHRERIHIRSNKLRLLSSAD